MAKREDRPAVEPAPPPAEERRAVIAQALHEGQGTTHPVPTEGGYLDVPLCVVPTTALVYRADNGRVLLELAEAAAKLEVGIDELKKSAESPEVQTTLHELLADKARDPAGPIFQELEKHGQQTEPLLIKSDGLVVNGNRRLAAMRELAADRPERYPQFRAARVAVLPDRLDDTDIEFIEAALQMAPDLKLGYGWLNRRLKLRQHVRDLDRERVVAAYRFSAPEEVERELSELRLAEQYLKWVGQPLSYGLVAKREQAFVGLNAQLSAKQPPHHAKLWQTLGFAMLSAADELDRELLHYYPFSEPKPPALRLWALRTLAEERGLVARQAPGENRPVDPELAARLLTSIDDPARAASTARAVVAVSDILKADPQRLLGVARVLTQLRSVRDHIAAVGVDAIPEPQLRQIRAELHALNAELAVTRKPIADSAASGRTVVARKLQRWLGKRASPQRKP